jgi:hypothetical protein
MPLTYHDFSFYAPSLNLNVKCMRYMREPGFVKLDYDIKPNQKVCVEIEPTGNSTITVGDTIYDFHYDWFLQIPPNLDLLYKMWLFDDTSRRTTIVLPGYDAGLGNMRLFDYTMVLSYLPDVIKELSVRLIICHIQMIAYKMGFEVPLSYNTAWQLIRPLKSISSSRRLSHARNIMKYTTFKQFLHSFKELNAKNWTHPTFNDSVKKLIKNEPLLSTDIVQPLGEDNRELIEFVTVLNAYYENVDTILVKPVPHDA